MAVVIQTSTIVLTRIVRLNFPADSGSSPAVGPKSIFVPLNTHNFRKIFSTVTKQSRSFPWVQPYRATGLRLDIDWVVLFLPDYSLKKLGVESIYQVDFNLDDLRRLMLWVDSQFVRTYQTLHAWYWYIGQYKEENIASDLRAKTMVVDEVSDVSGQEYYLDDVSHNGFVVAKVREGDTA